MQVIYPACGPPSASFSVLQKFSESSGLLSPLSSSKFPHSRSLGFIHGQGACAGGLSPSGSGGQAMAARETATHLYEEEEELGKGGSCTVYCGVAKGTGQRHALKVLRNPTPQQRFQLQQEVETLSKISCPNIVRFYDVTHEVGSGRPVVALEFCSGGSLLSYLQLPENARGLEDDELLTLLANLVDALSYLRSQDIVHRDIKPGNILRDVQGTGKVEYKLSDFGTSHEATDQEQTTTIAGTEEYLHPILYKKAFFSNTSQAAFNPISGELWSLACTLYHAMTGSVPFQPLCGARKNRKAMLVLITQKPPGSISGDQDVDGNFRWSGVLPGNCRLSESLGQKVVPLLQNLLEPSENQWSFATFLDESQRILAMRGFYVCDTECGSFFRLYLGPKQSLAELQDALAYYTELPAGQQLLFHRVQPLHSMLSACALAKDLPNTCPAQPLLLLSSQGTEGRCRRPVRVQPTPLSPEATLEENIEASFRECIVLHCLSLQASDLNRLPNILFSATLALRNSHASTISTVETRFRVLSATCQERQSRLAILTTLQTIVPSDLLQAKLNEARLSCDKLREELWRLKYMCEEIRKAAEGTRFSNPLSDTMPHRRDSPDALQNMFKTAKEIWQRMRRRRQKIPLSPIEQEKQKGDVVSLNALCTDSATRMKEMQAKKVHLVELYSAEFRQLCERLRLAEDIDNQLVRQKEESEQFSTLLDEIWMCQSEDLRRMSGVVQKTPGVHKPPAGVPGVLSGVVSSLPGVYNSLPGMQNPPGAPAAPTAVLSPRVHNWLGSLLSEELPNLETFSFASTDSSEK